MNHSQVAAVREMEKELREARDRLTKVERELQKYRETIAALRSLLRDLP